ncbi:MAG: DUF1801 domain-containing protein [Deltaproteobacteria bacterium]|nr:DUF1801 domain-containing protein [Deltaproteobacteria bacterium]
MATSKPTASKKSPAKRAPKTQPTAQSVSVMLASLEDTVRADCEQIDRWMRDATGTEGVLYGSAIAGYGSSVIRYADGRESPWMKMGFAARAQSLVLYGLLSPATERLLDKVGKCATGKGCLYIKRLSDVDTAALEALIRGAASA